MYSSITKLLTHLRGPSITILCFHRVAQRGSPLAAVYPTAEQFAWKIQSVLEVMPIVPLQEALLSLQTGQLKQSCAAITFDDGYLDNFDIAMPILNSLGATATFFVCTGFLGSTGLPGERLRSAMLANQKKDTNLDDLSLPSIQCGTSDQVLAQHSRLNMTFKRLSPQLRDTLCDRILERLDYQSSESIMMSPHHLQGLVRQGMAVGSHSHRHVIPTTVPMQEFEADLSQSFAVLKTVLGEQPKIYAYPNGKVETDFNASHRATLERCEVSFALSTQMGLIRRPFDQFNVRRFTPWESSKSAYKRRLLVGQLYQSMAQP